MVYDILNPRLLLAISPYKHQFYNIEKIFNIFIILKFNILSIEVLKVAQ